MEKPIQAVQEAKVGLGKKFSCSNIILVSAALVIAFSTFYYFVILGEERITQQQEQERQRQVNLSSCLSAAFDAYNTRWDGQCKRLGKKKNCPLPQSTSDRFEKDREKDEDQCYLRYPAN